jgi:hypothetical protein
MFVVYVIFSIVITWIFNSGLNFRGQTHILTRVHSRLVYTHSDAKVEPGQELMSENQTVTPAYFHKRNEVDIDVAIPRHMSHKLNENKDALDKTLLGINKDGEEYESLELQYTINNQGLYMDPPALSAPEELKPVINVQGMTE